MNVWITIIFGLFFLSPRLSYALDQTGNNLISQGLAQGLSGLKNSVEQMSASNEALALKNTQLKARLNNLQMALEKLNHENQELNKAKSRLDEVNPAKTKQIEQLEKRSGDLDSQGVALEDQIKKAKDHLADDRQEEQKVNDHINQMLNSPVPPSSEPLPAELVDLRQQREKEKLGTLKMISEIQDHRHLLEIQISDFQKGLPPNSGNVNQKEVLEKQVQQLQEEVNQLASLTSLGTGWNEEQMHRLEANISELEKKRDELNDLIVQMQKKAQTIHLTEDQKNEEVKLQANIDKLKQETKSLKFDLETMQQQMIDLDKRKTYLESILK